jgi:hypothetical protein
MQVPGALLSIMRHVVEVLSAAKYDGWLFKLWELKQYANSHLLISAKQLLIAAGANMGAENANGYVVCTGHSTIKFSRIKSVNKLYLT